MRLSDILSRTVSKLSQIIAQILDEQWPLYVFEPSLGLRGNVQCYHFKLIGKLVGLPCKMNFFASVSAEELRANID